MQNPFEANIAVPTIAKLDYPKPIAKEIASYEAKLSAWSQALAELEQARAKLGHARAEHHRAIYEAANNGEQPPAAADVSAIETAITYAEAVLAKRRLEAETEAEQLRQTFLANHETITRLAIEKADAGAARYESAVESVRAQLADADRARRAAYDGLEMVCEWSREVSGSHVHADFGHGIGVELPPAREHAVRSVIGLLRKLALGETQAA